MSRTGKIKKRKVLKSDPICRSPLVTRFVNRVMERGKKAVAEKIVYAALESLSQDKGEAKTLLKKAVENVRPSMEVRPRRVGGATYQIPLPVKHDRSEALAIRWIIKAAQKRKGLPMKEKLALEFKDALLNQGAAVKKKEGIHRLAEANRAFAHFRW